jgi:hypothetical protein
MMLDTMRPVTSTLRWGGGAATTRRRTNTADNSCEDTQRVAIDDPDAHHRVLTRLTKLDVSRHRTKPPEIGPVPSLSEAAADPSAAERRMKDMWFKAAVSKPWHEGLMEEEGKVVKKHEEGSLPRVRRTV